MIVKGAMMRWILWWSKKLVAGFRFLNEGLGGTRNKRKRPDEEEEHGGATSMDLDNNQLPLSKRAALPSLENPENPIFGKPTYDGTIAGRVSGRKWKQPRERRSSACKVSLKGTTYEERSKQKEIKKAYKERVNELKEEIRMNKVEKRKKKEEREKKKKENIAVELQKRRECPARQRRRLQRKHRKRWCRQ